MAGIIDNVGFTAEVTEQRNYSVSELILFERALTNIGDHYNAGQSVFICPVGGIYVIYVNIQATTDGPSMVVDIIVNDIRYTTASADDVASAFNTGSNMVVVTCLAGQQVWVESNQNSERIHTAASTFSGFLLSRIS